MLGSVVIECILSVCFYFFLLSVIVSLLIEFVSGLAHIRGRMLKSWFLKIDGTLGESLYNHPLIQGYPDQKATLPSYVEEPTFAKAVLELVTRVGKRLTPPVNPSTGAVTLPPVTAPLSQDAALARLQAGREAEVL